MKPILLALTLSLCLALPAFAEEEPAAAVSEEPAMATADTPAEAPAEAPADNAESK